MGAFLWIPTAVALASFLTALYTNAIVSELALRIISSALPLVMLSALLVVLGRGWVKGFPRWSFPYWGMALALSGLFSDQSG